MLILRDLMLAEEVTSFCMIRAILIVVVAAGIYEVGVVGYSLIWIDCVYVSVDLWVYAEDFVSCFAVYCGDWNDLID